MALSDRPFRKLRARLDTMATELVAFEDAWPHVLPIIQTPSTLDWWAPAGLEREARRAEQAKRIAWAAENLGEHATLRNHIGCRDPNDAFWFRMVWH